MGAAGKGLAEGHAVLVTGGGSGIGRATSILFAREGARVVVVDAVAEGAKETVEIIGGEGGEAIAVQADVTDEAAVRATIAKTVEHYGRLDSAFNNAGISDLPAPLHELSLEAWDRMIAVNLTGVFLCMKHEIVQMLQQERVEGRRGAIVNTSSGAGFIAAPGMPHYTAAKHGVLGVVKNAAQEYYDEGIRVFNAAIGPKALLTIDGAQHGAYYSTEGTGHEATAVVTTDFLWAWLRDDADAAARLAAEPVFDDADVTAALEPGDTTTLEPTTIAADRTFGATPLTGLVDGTTVTVTWSGFIDDGTINIVQCSGGVDPGSDACDLARAILLRPNPGGDGTAEIEVYTGVIGSGSCGPGIDDCHLAVNDSGLSDPDATIYLPLEFAPEP